MKVTVSKKDGQIWNKFHHRDQHNIAFAPPRYAKSVYHSPFVPNGRLRALRLVIVKLKES